jgi:hypothetical protein
VADVILEASEQVTVECDNLNVKGHDLLLDSASRRKSNSPQFRRAMVHDTNDGLTINFDGDYPGGVAINGVTELRPMRQPGTSALATPTLVVRGAISYEAQGLSADGSPAFVTVFLEGELGNLQTQISDLVARVAALEAK